MRFREHYTELVEHYFRMAVRHKEVKQSSDFDWFLFTSFWIDSLSDEDKQFIFDNIAGSPVDNIEDVSKEMPEGVKLKATLPTGKTTPVKSE